MRTAYYKNFRIDYHPGAAAVYKDDEFLKGLASDDACIETGLTGFEKAKKWIDGQK